MALKPYFSEYKLSLHPANHCMMFLNIAFDMYSSSISLTAHVITAVRGWHQRLQSSGFLLNCNQDFYKKKQQKHKQKNMGEIS